MTTEGPILFFIFHAPHGMKHLELVTFQLALIWKVLWGRLAVIFYRTTSSLTWFHRRSVGIITDLIKLWTFQNDLNNILLRYLVHLVNRCDTGMYSTMFNLMDKAQVDQNSLLRLRPSSAYHITGPSSTKLDNSGQEMISLSKITGRVWWPKS